MGLDIDRTEFSEDEHASFSAKLANNLHALKHVLGSSEFGQCDGSLGAELELYIVTDDGQPLAANTEIHEAASDPQLTLELNRFNLEFNLTPVAIDADPLNVLEQEMVTKVEGLNKVARNFDGNIATIGILPTLNRDDFGPQAMTQKKRYRALSDILRARREDSFAININGKDPVKAAAEDLTFEGANTSLQLHYVVKPDEFATVFNSIQYVTPLVLAVGANSPFFMGQRLWHETRVPLFKQSIDGRNRDRRELHLPSRVDFGHGWVRHGAYELFAESVHLHRPLLPVCSDEDPLEALKAGKLPDLFELKLHQGTLWYWNRPIYDSHGDGHVRVELRSLPAGPSAVDMVANCAFHLGLAEGIRDAMEDLIPAVPFKMLEYNFYRAAQFGLDARLLWPRLSDHSLQECSAQDIALAMLDLAYQGLDRIGIDSARAAHYLGNIERRLTHKRTGATWQLDRFEQLFERQTRDKALQRMLVEYMEYSASNVSVGEWDLQAGKGR